MIVQRNELFARSLARYLSHDYSRVVVVSTAADAELALRAAPGAHFHVVCGQVLGAREPDGATCLSRWKAEFPHVTRAILATGADEPTVPAGVDGLFHKPSDPSELLALLRVSAHSASRAELHQPPTHKDIMTSNKTKAHDLKTLKERATVAAASKTSPAVLPKVAQGFTIV